MLNSKSVISLKKICNNYYGGYLDEKKRKVYSRRKSSVERRTYSYVLLHYKYYKNNEADISEQYCNIFNSVIILTDEEQIEIYHKLDSIIEKKQSIVHYELDKITFLSLKKLMVSNNEVSLQYRWS